MDKKQELQDFIWDNIDQENGSVIESEGIEDIYGLMKAASKKFNVALKITRVGGFDSPGYTVNCYAWSGIVDGELYLDSVEQEYY